MLSADDKEIYLACGYTDMRKSINGLTTIVQSSFKLDPFNASIYVFCNKHKDRIKILEWDGNGFWLHLKRLERGKFSWPAEADDENVMHLTSEELKYLLGAPGLQVKLKRKSLQGKIQF